MPENEKRLNYGKNGHRLHATDEFLAYRETKRKNGLHGLPTQPFLPAISDPTDTQNSPGSKPTKLNSSPSRGNSPIIFPVRNGYNSGDDADREETFSQKMAAQRLEALDERAKNADGSRSLPVIPQQDQTPRSPSNSKKQKNPHNPLELRMITDYSPPPFIEEEEKNGLYPLNSIEDDVYSFCEEPENLGMDQKDRIPARASRVPNGDVQRYVSRRRALWTIGGTAAAIFIGGDIALNALEKAFNHNSGVIIQGGSSSSPIQSGSNGEKTPTQTATPDNSAGSKEYTKQELDAQEEYPILLGTKVGEKWTPKEPTLSISEINRVLALGGSPCAGMGDVITKYGLQYGIDPAVALAFFMHESTLGTTGVARITHSLGNLRTRKGQKVYIAGYTINPDGTRTPNEYAYYDTWEEGIKDFYDQLFSYVNGAIMDFLGRFHHNLDDIEKIPSVWAPNSDHNNEEVYVASLRYYLAMWHRGKTSFTELQAIGNGNYVGSYGFRINVREHLLPPDNFRSYLTNIT